MGSGLGIVKSKLFFSSVVILVLLRCLMQIYPILVASPMQGAQLFVLEGSFGHQRERSTSKEHFKTPKICIAFCTIVIFSLPVDKTQGNHTITHLPHFDDVSFSHINFSGKNISLSEIFMRADTVCSVSAIN